MRQFLVALLFCSPFAAANPVDDRTLYLGPFGEDVALTAPLGMLDVIGSGPLFDLIVPHGRTTTFDVFDLSYCHCQGDGFSYEIHVGPYIAIVTAPPASLPVMDDGFVGALLRPGTYHVSTTGGGLLDFNFFTRPGEGVVHRVPEPDTLALFMAGALALVTLRRRRPALHRVL